MANESFNKSGNITGVFCDANYISFCCSVVYCFPVDESFVINVEIVSGNRCSILGDIRCVSIFAKQSFDLCSIFFICESLNINVYCKTFILSESKIRCKVVCKIIKRRDRISYGLSFSRILTCAGICCVVTLSSFIRGCISSIYNSFFL